MQLPNADDLPPGELRGIYLHWTGGDYEETFAAYHFCIAGVGAPRVVATHDLQANMRDVRAGGAYAAHTHGRNSFAAGIALCAMRGAEPHDFGAWPVRDEQVELACALAARLCERYGIALEAVRTHAEAAVEDGYFGCAQDERWDVARLQPSPGPLVAADALATAAEFRRRVSEHARARS
jgi:N-acetyl-anhydromuramyl-L-alanine amidase AmpD